MIVALLIASLVAGWIDAVIGGGGLVLIPVLMSTTGMPAAAVLATNKFAAFTGTSSAAVTMVRKVGVPRCTWGFALAAMCASAGGALAVALVSDSVVRPLIIVLLLAVGIFVVCKPSFGEEGNRILTPRRAPPGAAAALLIGGYDGIFGPGTGMFLIMAFTAVFSQTFLESAAMAKVVNTATNIGALSVFIAGGYVDWSLAIALAIANVIGAQLGARTVLHGGSKLVRIALLTLVVVLCARLGWQEFVQ